MDQIEEAERTSADLEQRNTGIPEVGDSSKAGQIPE